MITFQHPDKLLFIMAAGAVIFFGYLLLMFRASRVLKHLGGRKTLRDQGGSIGSLWTDILRAGAVCLVFLLFACAYWLSPQITQAHDIPIYEGAEVCFAIDASRSSRALDVKFVDSQGREQIMSRYNFAKAIVRTAKSALSPDDTPCLIFFAESAVNTVLIFFGFTDVAWEYIESDLRYADEYFVEHEIPQGSNFTALILKALDAFSDRPTKKILMVISDGEPEIGLEGQTSDQKRTSALVKIREAKGKLQEFRKKHDFAVEFLGVGNVGVVSPIPKKIDKTGKVIEYHRFISGAKKDQTVLTRPDPTFLFDAAQFIGGKYRHLKDPEEAARALTTILTREKRALGWQKKEEVAEAWQYFVWAGLLLLFAVPFMKSP